MKFDLNCDLGEGEPTARTEALMRAISSANVACGGHAGTVNSMRRCIRLAKKYGVRLGAHPGPEETTDFGRGAIQITPEQLEALLLKQVSALRSIAAEEGVPLHHIKLHGALYHATEFDTNLARRYAETVKRKWPGVKIFARAAAAPSAQANRSVPTASRPPIRKRQRDAGGTPGRVADAARHIGVVVWEEAFLDRGYLDDGNLVPRPDPGALLTNVTAVITRLRRFQTHGEILSVSGQPLRLHAKTLCIHSDTPSAIRLAQAVARELYERPNPQHTST